MTSWAYVAGFTDGDGCIGKDTKRGTYVSYRLRWHQKEASSQVLDAIAEFLQAQGLKVGTRNFSVSTAGHKYPQRELSITNAADTRLALHAMLPHLILKRDKAVEALAHLDQVHELKLMYGNKYRRHLAA